MAGHRAGVPTWEVPTAWFEEILEPAVAARRRPTWFARGRIYVPRLTFTHEQASLHNAQTALEVGTLLVLEAPGAQAALGAWQNERVRAQLKQLAAAALTDVIGLPIYSKKGDRSVAALLDWNERWTREAVTTGRRLWPKLSAWPWWALNPQGGSLPPKWWTIPRVIESLAAWRAGS